MTQQTFLWSYDWADAFAKARETDKLVLAKVEKEDCIGCEQLDAFTFPDPAVSTTIRNRFVSLKLDHKDPAVRALNLIWLPTVYILDKREVIHYRSINALPPEDFLDVLDLGEAHARLREASYEAADQLLSAALIRRSKGPLTDELLYWSAIARYFVGNHDHSARDAIWTDLRKRFPDSIWTHRVPEFLKPERLEMNSEHS